MKRLTIQTGIGLLIAAATLLLYWGSLDHGFLPYDDDVYVTQNPLIQMGLSREGLALAFHNHEANWIPLTWISLAADFELGGLEPRGYHRTNLLLHMANSVLLFLALSALTRSRWPSAFTAAVFALHPLHVESVAWVAERKDVLCGFFWMLSLWLYAGYARSLEAKSRAGSLWRYLLVALSMGLALMAKPMAVTLPLVLLLLDFWPLERLSEPGAQGRWSPIRIRRAVLEKIPLLLLSAGSSIMTYRAQLMAGSVAELEGDRSLSLRIWNALLSYGVYFKESFWPTDLAVLYPHPGENISIAAASAVGIALALVTLACFALHRRAPHLLVGWLWFIGTLVPVIGLVQVGTQAHADRYMYLPLIGLTIAVTWSFASLLAWQPSSPTAPDSDESPRRTGASASGAALGPAAVAAVAIASLVALGLASRQQLQYWESPVTLFEHSLSVSEPIALSHHLLAESLIEQERFDEALEHYKRASQLDPGWVNPIIGAAGIHGQRGELKLAHSLYSGGVTLKPNDVMLRLAFARALIDSGQPGGALAHLVHALQQEEAQYIPELHAHLGLVRIQLDQPERALDHFHKALALAPDSAELHGNLGLALHQLKRNDEAMASYRRALSIDASIAGVHGNLGVLLSQTGNKKAGISHMREASRLGADDANLYFSLYSALYREGDRQEALGALRRAVELKPDWLEARNNLAWHLATVRDPELKQPQEALKIAMRTAGETGYTDPNMLDTFAVALAANGRIEEAEGVLQKALELVDDGSPQAASLQRRRAQLRRGELPE